MTTDLEESVNQ